MKCADFIAKSCFCYNTRITNPIKINAHSEYGKLKSVIVNDASSLVPFGQEFFAIKDKYGFDYEEIEVKYHPEAGVWDKTKLQKQVQTFQTVLKEKGVELIFSNNVQDAWLQVFTRDIGFAIGDTFYIGTMRQKIRALEQKGIELLQASFSKVVALNIPHIEGGDVFVHHDTVFVGLGRQTTVAAFEELQSHVEKQGFRCYPIVCGKSVLHLDCRFNIINKTKAFLSTYGISKEGIKILEKHFDILLLTDEELATLASNYFIISPDEAVVDTRNKRISSILRREGYSVTELEYSEVTKLWGSFRCTTCPLLREEVL